VAAKIIVKVEAVFICHLTKIAEKQKSSSNVSIHIKLKIIDKVFVRILVAKIIMTV
jgi:hypothetical protein